MVLEYKCAEEFTKGLVETIEGTKNTILLSMTKREATSYVIGRIGSLRILSEKLLSPEEFKEIEKYLNTKIEQLSEVVKSLPRE